MNDFIATSIARSGFATIQVEDPEGSFAYTVGFTELGHPEGRPALTRWPVARR